ncbi:hypothetical protein D9613_004949 [Agrocybe pediades]|uniref:Arrestin-like N-terminal domain-containing protein n=1 Tax=Agrocybe pediades TaxID=84607 RepID=A0A8H4VRU1_9AGAR|nr:hypothetical protein D9613_004949 [Agrocybe pediades]
MSIVANSTPAASCLPPPRSPSHLRSQSENIVSQPPRYSSLNGALPANFSLDAVNDIINNTAINLDGVSPPLRPPRYSSVFHTTTLNREGRAEERRRARRATPGSNHDQDRTASSFSSARVFEYHIKGNGKTSPWATLKVYSRSAASAPSTSNAEAQKIPRFTGQDLFQGSLELDLDSPQTINSISLSLRGRVVTSSYDDGSATFLDHHIVSWNRNKGDPREMLLAQVGSTSSAPSSSRSPSPKKFEGKLSGQYSWPFSFPFPSSVVIPGQADAVQIPQTFLERNVKGSVQYELVLRITHGMLRSDSKLQVDVSYVPDITPSPSSILRQLSYGENLAIPGPEVDPAGWSVLPPVTMRGKLFGERNVKFQCTLSLANPKSYTRGTFIPCHLSVYSSDTEALELVATPKHIAVHLVRRVQYYQDPNARTGNNGNGAASSPVESQVEVERAVWWTSQDVTETTLAAEATSRQFSGEIHLDKDLQASSVFPLFKISYDVELLPFRSSVFQPSRMKATSSDEENGKSTRRGYSNSDIRNELDVHSRPLLSHPVTIATLHGEGPTPIPFTKPKPRKDRRARRTTKREYTYLPHAGQLF